MNLVQVEIEEIHIFKDKPLNLVLLREIGGKRILPIYIGNFEVAGLEEAVMKKRYHPRPCTYELFEEVIKAFSLRIKMVEIYKIENEIYYAYIYFTDRNKRREHKIDCRPSDAMVLAYMKNAPIYVNEEVFKKAGIN